MFLCPSNSLFPSVDTWKNKQTKILFNLISQINYIFNFLLIVFTFKCPSWCFTSRVIHGTCLHINPFLSFKTAYSHENDVSCSDSLSSEWCLRQQNVTVSELNNHVKCLAQTWYVLGVAHGFIGWWQGCLTFFLKNNERFLLIWDPFIRICNVLAFTSSSFFLNQYKFI